MAKTGDDPPLCHLTPPDDTTILEVVMTPYIITLHDLHPPHVHGQNPQKMAMQRFN